MKKRVKIIGLLLMFVIILVGCKKEDSRHCWTNGHCYEAILEPLSWYDARAACENLGGYLATITSEDENEFVFNLVKDNNAFWYLDAVNNGLGPWLGGYQEDGAEEPDGGWRWVTGEAWSYTNWETGQPDDVHGAANNQNVLRFFKAGGLIGDHWDDSEGNNPVEHRKGYICEFE
jgi:hypothetical protein